MRLHKFLQYLLVTLTSTGLLLQGQLVMAAGPDQAAPTAPAAPRNVELQPGGVLTGWIVDGHGKGIGSSRLALHNGNKLVAETQTDASGAFRIEGLRGGVYQLSTDGATAPVRAWAHQTAPPGALQHLMLHTSDVVAGQYNPMKFWLADPLIIGGVIAVAAGVPIILANQNNDSGS
jgi:hypothetical protein